MIIQLQQLNYETKTLRQTQATTCVCVCRETKKERESQPSLGRRHRVLRMVDVALSCQGLVSGGDRVRLEQTMAEQPLSTKHVPLITEWFGQG